MDGADTIDRTRLRRTHDVEIQTPERDGWDEWFGVDQPLDLDRDPSEAWWSGEWDSISSHQTSGCGGLCPFCQGTVYESSEDARPLSFWTESFS